MKSILLWAILLLCVLHTSAQTTPASAKPDFKLVFEKTYLHTDRNVYAQQDTLWFKAYLVNAQTNELINSSGNLYVELVSVDSAKVIGSEIIRLTGGLGNGDFDLDEAYAPGKYRLRAYTNWMRNFGDNFIFDKNITILNTTAIPALAAQSNTTAPAADKSQKKTTAGRITVAPVTTKPLNVRFYPEGGSLVEGISSVVAVKAEDGFGKGIAISGAVLSAAGDTISRFICDTLGMGLFAILPVKGQVYHAVAKKSSFDFPAPLSKGLTIEVKQTDTVLNAVISSSDNPANMAVKPHYTLEVKHGGKAFISQQLQVTAQQTAVKISTATLPEGISAVTLYDEQNKPNCERLVYIHHPNTPKATATTNKRIYKSKEPVTVQISAGRAPANLSLAVVDAGVVPEQADDIVAYLMLQSEVKGDIEHAHRYFDTTNVNRFKQLDLLLLTQGWRDFVWRRLVDTAIRISYAAENGISVSGKVRDEIKNKIMPGLNISLFATAAKGNKILSARSDSLGHFNFQGLMLYGSQNIKLASMNDKGEKKGTLTVDTVLSPPVNQQNMRISAAEAATDSATKAAIDRKAALIKASRIYGVTRLREVKVTDMKNKNKAIVLNDNNIYTQWGASQTFNITPKDYEYKTLSWFLVQKGKGALPNNSGSGVVFIADGKRSNPRLIINGAEIYGVNRDLYFSMPIDRFKSIVIKEVVQTGPGMPLKYLLYLNLKDDYLTDNPGSLSLNIPGYYSSRAFYKPLATAKPSLDDYRTTIHWEPNIKTDANGHATINFNNAVPSAHVRVIVQGIAGNGTPVAAVTGFEVR